MCTLLLLLMFQNAEKTVFVDRVAIKVNDKIITEREVIHSYKQSRADIMQQFTGAELDTKLKEAWADTINFLEERLLLFEKAVELGMAVSEDDARSRLMAVKESNGLNDEEFEVVLREQTGMTLGEYVDFQKREQSADMVIRSQVLSRIKIEDSEVAKYYDEHIANYQNPATYRIAELVFLKGQGSEEALSRAREALDFMKFNDDFAEAAKRFSDSTSRDNGGDLGLVQYGDFNEAIESKVAAMEPGQVSEPFETAGAWFIIKLLERNPATPKKVEEVRDEILQQLRIPRMETEMKAFMAELKGKYLLHTYLKEPPFYLEL